MNGIDRSEHMAFLYVRADFTVRVECLVDGGYRAIRERPGERTTATTDTAAEALAVALRWITDAS